MKNVVRALCVCTKLKLLDGMLSPILTGRRLKSRGRKRGLIYRERESEREERKIEAFTAMFFMVK